MPIDAANLRDFAVRYTAAWCSQDPASVAAFFSPAASLTVNRAPAVGRGISAPTGEGNLNLLASGVRDQSGEFIQVDISSGDNRGNPA